MLLALDSSLKHRRSIAMEHLRLQAVQAALSGRSSSDVAKEFGLTLRCLYKWLASYRAAGVDSLRSMRAPGRPAKFTAELMDQILDAMERHDVASGKRTLWTSKSLQSFALDTLSCRLSRSGVQRMLARIGIRANPVPIDYEVTGACPAFNEVWFGPSTVSWQQRQLIMAVRAPRDIYFQILCGAATAADISHFIEGLLLRSSRQIILIPCRTEPCYQGCLADLSGRYSSRLILMPSDASTVLGGTIP